MMGVVTEPTEPTEPVDLNTLYRLVGIEPPTLRRADIEGLSGIDRERSLRWWRAMGFAEVADDELAFGSDDIAVVQRLRSLLDLEVIDDGDILRLARLMGASFSRLVGAQLDVIADALIVDDGGTPKLAPAPQQPLDEGSGSNIVAFIESTMNYVWRRHLLAAIAQRLHAGQPDGLLAVGFADLSGFSRISKGATRQEITEIVETFEAVAFDVVSTHEGRVVKLIGDEVMFVSDTVDDAVAIALELIQRLEPEAAVPPIHCGIAFGETVSVGGDVFGATVNLASRLTGVARPNTVMVRRADGMHLLEREDLDARPHRRVYDLKGVGRFRAISIRPLDVADEEPDTNTATDTATDPV